ncbi:hypothetical protein MTO96_050684 [Rhipicephalus appendiculatus]
MAVKVVFFGVVMLAILLPTSFAADCSDDEWYQFGLSSSCGEHLCGETEHRYTTCTIDPFSRCLCKEDLYRRSSDDKCVPKEEC